MQPAFACKCWRVGEGYRKIANTPDFGDLPAARKKVVKNALRDFRLSGAELEGDARERFREIVSELSMHCNRFLSLIYCHRERS